MDASLFFLIKKRFQGSDRGGMLVATPMVVWRDEGRDGGAEATTQVVDIFLYMRL